MNRYSSILILALACIAVSLLSGMKEMEPLAWGISLLIPPVVVITLQKHKEIPVALLSVLLLFGISFLPEKRAIFGVAELLLAGFIINRAGDRATSLVVILSMLLFLGAVTEELVFGLPDGFKSSSELINNIRWGTYFLSSTVISMLIIGATHIIAKKTFNFGQVNFGIVPLIIFIAGAFLSFSNLNPKLTLIGRNIAISTFGVFIVQGFAIMLFFVDRIKTTTKLLLFFAFVFLPVLGFIMAGLTGMFDYWFDFRKIGKGGKDENNTD